MVFNIRYFIIIFLFSILLISNHLVSETNIDNEELFKMLKNVELSDTEKYNISEEISDNYISDKKYFLAIKNYNNMYENYHTDSKLVRRIPEILRNIAYLYQDSLSGNRLDNNKKAANYFKKIVTEFRSSIYTKEALQNSIFNFKLVNNYKEALSLIKLYNKLFFNDKLSNKYMIERANINYRLKKFDTAFSIYRTFSASNTDDSLVVEAYYKMGKILLLKKNSRNSIVKAKVYFEKARDVSNNLKISKISHNNYYFVESLFELADIEFNEFKKIDFKLPLTITIKQEYEKNKIYQSLLLKYDKILSYGNKRYSYALLRKIELLEEYGDTKYNQELDKKNNNIDDIVYRKEVYNLAGKFYEKAIIEYRKAIPLLEDFIKIYGKVYNDKVNNIRSVLSAYKLNINKRNHSNENISNDEIDEMYLNAKEYGEELLSDSTLSITKRKLLEAKNSIIRMQYTVASSNRNIAVEYLKIRSDYDEEDSDTYFEKLYFIDNAIIPLIENIVEAYHKTVKFSNEFKLKNQWVDKSIEEISSYSDVLSNAYISIVNDVFKTYESYLSYSFKYAKSNKRQYVKKIGDKILINEEIFEEMTSMIDYAKVASIKSINSFWKNLKESSDSKIIDNKILRKIENNLLTFILKTEDKNEEIRKKVIKNSIIADSIYWENPTKNKKYYLLSDYLQENNEIFDELSFMILYEGYEIIKKYSINNKISNTILHKLIQKKPSDFINKTGLETKKLSFPTDMKWFATSTFRNDFYRINYNKKFWVRPDIINKPIPKFKISSKLKKSISLWTKPSNEKDYSVIKSKAKNNYIPDDALFFRRDFSLDGIPVSGSMDLIVDDFFILIVNETTVVKFSDIEDKNGWRMIRSFDIGEYLRKGKNSVVIVATDNNKVNYGFKGNIQIELLKNYDEKNVIKLVK